MRISKGNVSHVAKATEIDMSARETDLRKTRIEELAH